MFDEQQFDERVFVGTNVRGNKCSHPDKCSTGTLPLCGRVGYIYYRLSRCVVLLVGLVCGGCGSDTSQGGKITRGLFSTPPVALSVSRPLFHDAAHVDLSYCRPRGFVPLSFSYPDVRGFYALGYESSTHVPVCEARPVQRGYANRMFDGGCVAVRSGGVI